MTKRPLELLVAATTTDPGEAFEIQDWIELAGYFATISGDYAASGAIIVVVERAEEEAGPWINSGGLSVANDKAGQLLVDEANQNRFYPWIRARLASAPSAGSISLNAYFRFLNG